MKSKRRLILLNQMAGPLFRELAEGVAPFFPEGAILLTGHPDTLAKAKNTHHKLRIIEAPVMTVAQCFIGPLRGFDI